MSRSYHALTRHSPEGVRSSAHYLDWDNQPLPFKIYEDLKGVPLPRHLEPGSVPALRALIDPPEPTRTGIPPDRAALGRLLHHSLGIIRERRFADGRAMYFRAAPCTGALYHVDAYVLAGDLPDLAAGAYQFAPHDFSLVPLRSGDLRGSLAAAAGAEPAVASAPLTIVLASTYWRNAWKYRARAYRHVFWDGGAILAQLLAEAAADGWPARSILGFADAEVEELCGLDPQKEGVVALLTIGSGAPASPATPVEPISFATRPLSASEISYPAILEAHAAGALKDGVEAALWRSTAAAFSNVESAPAGAIRLPPAELSGGEPLERIVSRRGSARRFHRRPIQLAALGTVLDASSAPLQADWCAERAQARIDLFAIVLDVAGIAAGCYRWYPRERALELVAPALTRAEAAELALAQDLGGDGAVDVYAVADLQRTIAALGPRGYRAAALEGGISGGRAYLAAYAQGLGATGLTFFDDDVLRALRLDPARFGVMFLTAVGLPAPAQEN